MRRRPWVAPLEIDCDSELRTHVRVALAIAAFFVVPAVIATVQFTRGYVLFLIPAPFAIFVGIALRGLRTMRTEGQTVVLSDGSIWTKDAVLAVHTSFETGSRIMGPARHLGFSRRYHPGVRLGLWTAEATTGARRARLARVLQAGDVRAPLSADDANGAVGAPDVHLMRAGSPLAALQAARSVAGALGVPWLHEGARGREVRLPAELDQSIGERTAAARGDAAGEARISWNVARVGQFAALGFVLLMLLVMAALSWTGSVGPFFAAFFLAGAAGVFRLARRAMFEHGEYSIEIAGDELVLRGLDEHRVALSQVMEVEVGFDQSGGLFIGLRGSSIELPVDTASTAATAARAIGIACAPRLGAASSVALLERGQ
jgi:hypothetical protein